MPGQLKIDQVGLPAGVAGVSRTDGLATGALVTITIVGSEGVNEVVLLWGPPDDTTAEASLAVTGDPAVWTFSPTPGTYGTYLIRLLEDGLEVDERVFGVRTPNKGLLIPALNERASKTASWANDGADQVRISRNNAEDFDEAALNNHRYAGWWRSQHELYRVVDALVSGATAAAQYVLGAADAGLPNGRVATDSDEIEPQLGTPGIISWALKTGSVVFSKLANLTGLSVLGRASNSAGVMAAITATSSRQALLSNSAGTAIGWRSLELADLPTLPTPDWADVLAEDPSSGANNPSIALGQHLAFAGGGVSGGDIRSAGLLTFAATSDLYARAEGETEFDTGTTFLIRTNNTLRIAVTQSGELELSNDPGTSGQFLTSGGSGAPPTWTTVDLSSVTYTNGAGIALSSRTFSIDGIDAATLGMVPVSDGAGDMDWDWPITVYDSGFSQGGVHSLNFFVSADGDCDLEAQVVSNVAHVRPIINKASAFAWTGVHSFTAATFSVTTSGDVDINAGSGLALTAGVTSDITAIDAGDIVVAAASGMQIGVGSTAGNAIDGSADVGDLSVTVDADVSVAAGGGFDVTAGGAQLALSSLGNLSFDGGSFIVDSVSGFFLRTDLTTLLRSSSHATVQSTGSSLTLNAETTAAISSDSGDVTATANNGAVRLTAPTIVVDSASAAGGFLVLRESSASTPTVPANHGMLSVTNDSNPVVRFTAGNGADHNLAFGPPADQVSIESPSGNLGTINLGAMRSGGYVVITPVSAAWQIEGWTCDNHEPGFWFHLFVTNGAFTGTLLNEDNSASGNNRMRCGGNANVSGEAIQATIYCISTTGSTKRWSVVANS